VHPQHTDGRTADQTFAADELLFRRVPISHIEDGELSLLAIGNGLQFEKDPPKCSSVVRGKYCGHFSDALHPDCAEDKPCPNTTVYFLRVGNLAKGMMIDPPEKVRTRSWDLYPHHDPLTRCYAHSTICSCEQREPNVPVKPPKSVREQFRKWLSENLQSCDLLKSSSLAEADSAV
jgi:hypothetical protein